ncbi:plasmid mobilization protein [Arachidicoccus soli]|uniref:Plasmid mobilization relaxosome protein MobC n=1 Tax=Arachidicoccus soli TaxID=2341117 RepID=A0A386HNS0_9BACT|nr:plasmid mobilization relaxosome protein MobC [Arachidicoccus soli]AYD47312.1 plasmid mobilization relaxosome protein MobC [Arachidicoccus soli]
MENINKNTRNKALKIYLSSEEYQVIRNNLAETTHLYMSEYLRKILLKKPIIGSYRDQTMEDLMNVLVELKNELNSIGNNFNLAIKELHSLQHIAEYKP